MFAPSERADWTAQFKMKRFQSESEIERIKRVKQSFKQHTDAIKGAEKDIGEDTKKSEEEDYDPRPLYERLQEARENSEKETLEKYKLSNQIAKVNEDDFDYLEELKALEERKRTSVKQEEKAELRKYRLACEEKVADRSNEVEIRGAKKLPLAAKVAKKKGLAVGSLVKRRTKSRDGSKLRDTSEGEDGHEISDESSKIKKFHGKLVSYGTESDND